MTFDIQLIVDQDILVDDISISVDNSIVPYTIKNQCITVLARDPGLHILKLTTHTNKKINIRQVKIGGCSLRKLIYLSYLITQSGKRFQPATELWEADQTWVLPFGYPLSYWLDTVEQQIANGYLGKNLFKNFYFYYPESIKFKNNQFPQMIQDFFKYNFNFTLIDKANPDIKKIPYMEYTKEIPTDLIEDTSKEIVENLEFIMSAGTTYGQQKDNIDEFDSSLWRIIWLAKNKTLTEDSKKFPNAQKLINFLDLNYWHAFIGILPPGGFIYPHTDLDISKLNNKEFEEYQGCTQLYVPLLCKPGNYIKFAGGGTIELTIGQPMIINNDQFTHCVVNSSQHPRYVLAIRSHKDIFKDCNFNTI